MEELNKKQLNFKELKENTDFAVNYCDENGLMYNTKNEALQHFYLHQGLGEVFKKFKAWKKEGKQVQKGSKGLLFWSRPLNEMKADKEEQKRNITKEEREQILKETPSNFTFCFLFSNLQTA